MTKCKYHKVFVLFSENGKNLLLFLIFSMVIQGPMTNTLENFSRAADSVVCGAELTMNQTQELMQRAATPLFRELCLLPSSSASHVPSRSVCTLCSLLQMSPWINHLTVTQWVETWGLLYIWKMLETDMLRFGISLSAWENACLSVFLLMCWCLCCPLTAVLDKIKDISRNAYSVASRVQNFIQALTDSVQHVGEMEISFKSSFVKQEENVSVCVELK